MDKKTKKFSFEDSLKELEIVVKELESGDLSLEDSIKKFESGLKLSTYCNNFLDKAEKKIVILREDAMGNINEEPFDSND